MTDQMTGMTTDAIPATDFAGIQRQIHEFIQVNFLFDGGSADLDDAGSLVAQGILDDTGVLELVLFVEEAWGLTVDPQDLRPENFDSIDALAAYIVRRLSQR